jgi:acetyl-CoA acyltransferase
MAQTGLTHDDLGLASVKAYRNANKNPLAHMKAVQMDYEVARSANDHNPAFLANEALAPFMKMSDCSQVSDGGSALIVVSEAGLKRLGKTEGDAIEVLALTQTTGNLYEDGDATRLDCTMVAAQRAYAQAGLTPSQMNVAEVHDCFTITELLMTEALGFADYAQGAALLRDGRTDLDGDIPVNTGGGLVGFGHPVGATGVKQVLEIYRQMKGQCGDYQLGALPTHGITANMGGDDKTVVCGIYRNL